MKLLRAIRTRNLVTAFVLSAVSVVSFALDRSAVGVQVGPVTAYPSIAVSTRHDDNLFRSETNEKSTLLGIVAPAIELVVQDNIKKLKLDYNIEAGFYDVSGQDDYVDQELLGIFEYHPTDRITTELSAEYLKLHDPRGTERTEGDLNLSFHPDRWHSYGVAGLLKYGTPNATGRIELETSYVTKDYDNNREFTFVRDRDDFDLRGTFFYRIRPKTALLFEITYADFEYDQAAAGEPTLDSTDVEALVGVSWDATYKTTGYAKLGYANKDFDSDLRKDADDFRWEVGVKWSPRSYSTVNISTEQRRDESDGIGDSIDVAEIDFSWNHQWRDRFSTTVEFLYGEDEYDPSPRSDTRIRTGLKLNYDWRRWARVIVGYQYENRDSNINIFNYDRNLFDLTLNITL